MTEVTEVVWAAINVAFLLYAGHRVIGAERLRGRFDQLREELALSDRQLNGCRQALDEATRRAISESTARHSAELREWDARRGVPQGPFPSDLAETPVIVPVMGSDATQVARRRACPRTSTCCKCCCGHWS